MIVHLTTTDPYTGEHIAVRTVEVPEPGTPKRVSPWRGMGWLLLSTAASYVAKWAMNFCWWAKQRHKAARDRST